MFKVAVITFPLMPYVSSAGQSVFPVFSHLEHALSDTENTEIEKKKNQYYYAKGMCSCFTEKKTLKILHERKKKGENKP